MITHGCRIMIVGLLAVFVSYMGSCSSSKPRFDGDSGPDTDTDTDTDTDADTDATLCVPGDSKPCTCTNGKSGAQTCKSNGSGYDECFCTSDADGGDADTDSDSDTDTDTSSGNVTCDDLDPCGSYGTCVDTTGEIVCNCRTGYKGTYCAECATGYHWDDGECEADETCTPDPCDHGTCGLVSGSTVCTCEDGWSGNACNVCAPGYHLDDGNCVLDQVCMPASCSGHGTCEDETGVVVCTCETGYNAADYCATCVTNYHLSGGLCVADESCTPDPCDHGTCSAATKEVVCTCDEGWTGDTCDTCAGGYHKDSGNCVLDETCLDNSCSGHGECDISVAPDAGIDSGVFGVVVCDCEGAFNQATYCATCLTGFHIEGDTCELDEDCPVPNTSPSTACNSHGSCEDETKQIVCTCDEGWAGDTCTTCNVGFHDVDGDCVLQETCLPEKLSCANHGTCVDTTGFVVCTCDEGYTKASYCSECDTGYHTEGADCVIDEVCIEGGETDSCNNHGDCEAETGIIVCTCDCIVGDDCWAGDYCDRCATGYHPAEDAGVCDMDTTCTESTCGDHGTGCIVVEEVPVCSCQTGWDPETFCSTCADGYHTVGEDCVIDEVCDNEGEDHSCNNHGTCSTPEGVIVCACDDGYTGDKCDTCDTDYTDCGAGLCCDDSTHVCHDNACCPPLTCADKTDGDYVECGSAGDDECGGTIDCGECGGFGECDAGTCDCEDNYGVVDEGHECVYACDGYLPAVGCCDEDWYVNCIGAVLTDANCTLLAPPFHECGWYDVTSSFYCSSEGETPPDQVKACPANIVVDKTPVPCDDDGYEDNDTNDSTAEPVSHGTVLVATKCLGDGDFYRIDLVDNQTLTASIDFNHATANLDLVIWESTSDPINYIGIVLWAESLTNTETVEITIGEGYPYDLGTPMPAGTYYLEVWEAGLASTGYQLTVTTANP
ncbi:MAG: hypothetical protein GY847_26225 [Proteobacteria bacterium]|nr:hypothetical protein [Pseudomonadota bacterium]